MSFKDLDYRTLKPQHATVFPPTDTTKPRPLPEEIVVPTTAILRGHLQPFAFDHLATYVVNLAKGLADDVWRLDGVQPAAPHSARSSPQIRVDTSTKTRVHESGDLQPLDWSSFPILVDGTEVIIDFGDWNLINPTANQHNHWLRFHFHSSYKAYPWLGSFPPASFLDWVYYEHIQRKVRENRKPETALTVMNSQNVNGFNSSRVRRRLMVREMLVSEFGDRANTSKGPQPPFRKYDGSENLIMPTWHDNAVNALCYIQVPGSWDNILDRGQLQLMGLGVPVISPIMIDQCCDGMMQPGVHYLACRQDYKDVVDLVHWCEKNREEAFAIGHNAWMFFQEFCTPIAVWSYIKDRIDNGPRHWRQNIDDDFCPPGLYKPKVEGVAPTPPADTMRAVGP
jgi:hypothetical protein